MRVEVTGTVEFNQINFGSLGNVDPGESATLTCLVDSDVFMNSASFPTRGYDIDQSSFSLTLGTTVVGLQDPLPAGQTPYFVLRDNDPGVDGFFVATGVDAPVGVPIDEPGLLGQCRNDYSVTYVNTTVSSLDLLAALGTYDFTGLTVFNWTVDDGPFQPLGIVFAQMTISVDAGCPGDVNGDTVVNVLDLLEVLGNWGPCP